MQDLAVVNYGPGKSQRRAARDSRATIGDDEVLLEVQAVGVCGSDLHMWTAQQSWPMKYPVVLGHEFCGVIREVGRGVRAGSGGDRVVSETAAVIDPNSPLTRRAATTSTPTAAASVRCRRRDAAVRAGAGAILHRMPAGLRSSKRRSPSRAASRTTRW